MGLRGGDIRGGGLQTIYVAYSDRGVPYYHHYHYYLPCYIYLSAPTYTKVSDGVSGHFRSTMEFFPVGFFCLLAPACLS